ncbi:MAG TPA: type II 3-dehydroquinate dehydratase [Bacteroidia bacterium]|nr:type II 3-dehydroquinate dehydratase [Bacteroidia bacterium]
MKIVIINGPNLNLLGLREPGIYGTQDFNSYLASLQKAYPEFKIEYHQSNIEGEIINLIQENGFNSDGIILNAGGYTHTSIAIADAVAAVKSPVLEVHISNIYAREEERKTSLLSKHCKGSIAGLGLQGYELALLWITSKLKV